VPGQTDCTGAIAIGTLTRKTLGSGTYRVSAGKTAKATVKLTKTGVPRCAARTAG
jgi:hypothetical protein